MLIGSYHHTIEQKGRLAIPTAFRKDLGENPILTRGVEQCLYLLPFNNWSKTLEKLDPSFIGSKEEKDLVRLLSHRAGETGFDSQGRILVPSGLKTWANLGKKVVVAGSVNWVEIWDIETYNTHMETVDSQSESLVELVNKRKNE